MDDLLNTTETSQSERVTENAGATTVETEPTEQVEPAQESGQSERVEQAEDSQAEDAPEAKPEDKADKGDKADKAGKADKDEAGQWDGLLESLHSEKGAEAEVARSFVEHAKTCGLSPKQSAEMAAWFEGLQAECAQRMLKSGTEFLKKEWGEQAEARRLKALGLVSRIDRMTNNAFSNAIRRSGIGLDHEFMLALDAIAGMTGEDPGAGASSGSHATNVETELEGIREVFKNANAWKGSAQN